MVGGCHPHVQSVKVDFYDDDFDAGDFSLFLDADVRSLVSPTDFQETSKTTLVKFLREF